MNYRRIAFYTQYTQIVSIFYSIIKTIIQNNFLCGQKKTIQNNYFCINYRRIAFYGVRKTLL